MKCKRSCISTFHATVSRINKELTMFQTFSITNFRSILGGILLVALVLGSQSACVADHYDVYLLAGQSNMDGRGKASDLSELQQKPMEQAIIYYRNPPFTSNGWRPLKPGYSRPPKFKGELPSPTFGIEIGFAHAMVKAQPNTKFALIKGSKGGTNLRSDWKPGNKGDLESQGPVYRDFVETIRLATAELTKRGDTYTIRGLLWHQGESDAKKAKRYSSRLEQFIKRVREDIGVPDLPAVVGEVFDNGNRDRVRKAIQDVAKANSTVGLVTSEGTTTWDPGTHFDAASQLLLGNRYAKEMRELLKPAAAKALKAASVAEPNGFNNRSASRLNRPQRPNILFITVDDLNAVSYTHLTLPTKRIV